MNTNIPEFKSFGKIENIGKLYMTITQKLHGTNAQIYIYRNENNELQLKAGSRTRWITPEDDNYGFAQFVYDNKATIVEGLGEGRHYGEWCGPGINSGEGLKQKGLYLFYINKEFNYFPENIKTIPCIYSGKLSMETIEDIMNNLRKEGSYLVPGYMKPEGIVIQIGHQFYKKVFEQEESRWKEGAAKIEMQDIDISHLLQPIRLEKLLSRDSKYREDYPRTLPKICSDYVKDLEEEDQIVGNEDEKRAIKKALGKHIFGFVKYQMP